MAVQTIPILQIPIVQKTIQVTSGNLFQVASQYLGDSLQWTRIATLNNLGPDPFFTGLKVLRLPPVNANVSTGGILYS